MLDEGALSGPRHFFCKFWHNLALVKCPSAFRLRRLAQSAGRGLGLRHFTCKFSHRLSLRKCPSAFRLHRLAQSVGGGLGLRHFTCKFLHKGLVALVKCPSAFRSIVGPGMFLTLLAQNGFCETSKCISTAHARTKCSPRSWFAAFALQILAQSGSSAASTCISTAQARTKCGSRSWSAAFHLLTYCAKWLLCNVDVHFNWAGSHKVWLSGNLSSSSTSSSSTSSFSSSSSSTSSFSTS